MSNTETHPLGPLCHLIESGFPTLRTSQDVFDVAGFAKTVVGITRQGVYKWFSNDELPLRQAKSIVKKSNNRLTLDQFEDFVV